MNRDDFIAWARGWATMTTEQQQESWESLTPEQQRAVWDAFYSLPLSWQFRIRRHWVEAGVQPRYPWWANALGVLTLTVPPLVIIAFVLRFLGVL